MTRSSKEKLDKSFIQQAKRLVMITEMSEAQFTEAFTAFRNIETLTWYEKLWARLLIVKMEMHVKRWMP